MHRFKKLTETQSRVKKRIKDSQKVKPYKFFLLMIKLIPRKVCLKSSIKRAVIDAVVGE